MNKLTFTTVYPSVHAVVLAFALVIVPTLTIFNSTTIRAQGSNATHNIAINEQLSQQLRQHQIVKGDFKQLRILAGIPRPIRSSGRFIYWRNQGIYWETREPISQASTFTPNAIIHWRSASNLQQKARNTSLIQKQISRILLAVFGGDIQSLEGLFDSQWRSNSKSWTVELTPSMTDVGKVVKKITLSGENYVNSLKLDASNGDTTQIQFRNTRAFSHPAMDDCQYFDLKPSLCRSEN